MAQKKHKKRHANSTVTAKKQAAAAKLADEKDRARKRMDPTARNLLLGDLVFLSVISLLDVWGYLSNALSTLCSIVGLIILLVALWILFGRRDNSKGPRGGWPGLH